MQSWSDSFLDSFNDWMVLLGIVLTFIGVCAGILGYLSTKEIKRRDDAQKEESKAAHDRLAEEVVVAKKETAAAKEIAAQTQKAIQRRTLSVEQRRKLAAALALSYKGPVTIACAANDGESAALAAEILSVFKENGFDANPEQRVLVKVAEGIMWRIKDPNDLPDHALPILEAFETAGIPVIAEYLPSLGPESVEILVGTKPKE
jgi:hypothetical protein